MRSDVVTMSLTLTVFACSDKGNQTTREFQARLETTPLCPLVPARLPDAGSAPPTRVRAFGTDLGFSYQLDGRPS